MPPKRFSQKVRDDAPQEGEEEVVSEGGGDDDADDLDHVAKCEVCKQDTESWERDLLPETREKLKWTKVNKSRRTGKIKKTGRQCYHCEFGHKKSKINSIQEFLKKMEESEYKDEFMLRRRARVRGETRYLRLAKAGKITVTEKEENFHDMEDDGYCYYLESYLQQLKAPGHVFAMSTQQQIHWLKDNYNTDVHKDPKGEYVVMQSNLPQGAAYKYRKGFRKTLQVADDTHFDDADDAAEAVAETCKNLKWTTIMRDLRQVCLHDRLKRKDRHHACECELVRRRGVREEVGQIEDARIMIRDVRCRQPYRKKLSFANVTRLTEQLRWLQTIFHRK